MNNTTLSRRHFLQRAGVGAIGLAGCSSVGSVSGADDASAEQPNPRPAAVDLTRLSEHLAVYHGPINVGILHDGGKALLIDCGDGSVADVLPKLEITAVEQVLFTHHHRDQACGGQTFVSRGAK